MIKLKSILFLLFCMSILGSGRSQNGQEIRTVLLILDGLASGAIDRIPLENLRALKEEGCYYKEVHLPLPDHPKKSNAYPWSCSLPNPVLMSGTVFIGQPGIRENLIQHQFEEHTTAFVVNDGAYDDVAVGFDHYLNLRTRFEDLFRDELVLQKARHIITTEDPSFMRIHFQGPGSAGHRSTQLENAAEPWYHNIWKQGSPYIRQLKKADSLTAAFIRWMREEGRLENTVILIMGDHGQARTGAHPPFDPDSNKTELLILGNRVKSGVAFDYAEIIDVAPTITQLHDLRAPGYSIGRNLEEAFVGGPDTIPATRTMQKLNAMLIRAQQLESRGEHLPKGFKDIEDISTWHEGLSPPGMQVFLNRQQRLLEH